MTDATGESEQTSHGDYVPDADEYAADRRRVAPRLAADESLRDRAVALQVAAESTGSPTFGSGPGCRSSGSPTT